MPEATIPLAVWMQYLAGQLCYGPGFWWVIACVKMMGLKIENHKKLRAYYKEITREGQGPLLICPNHLTYVDSVILIYAFANHFWYVPNFKKHMWNLVAKEYSKNLLFRIVCYFSKCIYLDRNKEKAEGYPTLRTATNLLKIGEVVLIFPEGRRSKTGRFDDAKLAYGVGKVVEDLGECRVLCTYLRAPELGDKSRGFFPRGSNYKILTEMVHYKASDFGDHAAAKIIKDISSRIKKLEDQYFASLA
jgi:1-acyl-sn-glycerol-3-phosphate acyltransferase